MFCWKACLNRGPKTSGYAAVAVEHNKVFVFGGVSDEHNSVQMDVHVFNTVSLRWRHLTPVTTGREHHDLQGLSDRQGHTAVLIEDVVYIWGGYWKGRRKRCNVLYAFDVDTHQWVKPKVSGTVPEERQFHSACVLGKAMYIFGGFNEWLANSSNSIFKLDTTAMVWSSIFRGIPPRNLSDHSATIIGTKMFVFGGWGGPGVHYNNMRVFDTETNCWLSTPSAQLLPEVRRGHAAFVYNRELYIYGGCNMEQTFNDLWKFNLEAFSWKKVEPKGKHPPQMYHMSHCMVGDHFILFDRWLRPAEDMFILDLGLSPSLKTLCTLAVIQYDLEQSELPHNIRWELAAMTGVVMKSVQKRKCPAGTDE